MLMSIVNAFNEIHTSVWGVALVAGGIALTCCNEPAVGSTIITGGFALISSSSRQQSSSQTSVQTPQTTVVTKEETKA